MKFFKSLLPRRRRLRGKIDLVEGRKISGWAFHPKRPTDRVTIQARAVNDGAILAETVAGLARADLLAARMTDGNCAFVLEVDARPDSALRVELRDPATGRSFGIVDLPAKQRRVEGSIDTTLDRTISGWMRDPAEPERRVSVQAVAMADGQVLAETVADHPRDDLAAAGIGDGRHAFVITVDDRSEEATRVELRDALTQGRLGEVTLTATRVVVDQSADAHTACDRLLAPFIGSVRVNHLLSDKEIQTKVLYDDIITRYALFDGPYYLERYLGNDSTRGDPLLHYLTTGSYRSYCPNPYFDPSQYLTLNPDVQKLGIDPLVHYFLFGWREGRQTGSLFDGNFYLERYPDVREAGLSPLHHFMAFGREAGRFPSRAAAQAKLRPRTHFGETSSGRIVLVSHDLNVGGAQHLLRCLGEWLLASTKYEICFVAIRDGAHRHLFEAIAPVHVLADTPSAAATAELESFAGDDVKCLFLNSIASARFLDHWPRATPAICYVHELQKIIDLYPDAIAALDRRCNTIVGGSDAVLQNLRDRHGIDPAKLKLVYDFIEPVSPDGPSASMRAEQRKALGLTGDEFVVMGCGVMHWRKSPDKFIEVAERVATRLQRKCRFVWIGGGPDEAACRSLIRERKLDGVVSLLGYRENVPDFLEAGDLFLLPSEEDPFPLVCLYAAAKQAPIICFEDAGGMPEFVSRGCGVAVPFGDVAAMADAVIAYAENPALRDEHGAVGLRLVRAGFTVATAGPQLLDTLRGAMQVAPHVSVVVPNYNYEGYLQQRLATIASQTFQDFEVILLDDASADRSVETMSQWSARRPATRVIVNQENSGSPFRQWLKGMGEARAGLIWIAEADDFCEPGMLGALVAAMDDRNVFVAHAKSVPVDADGNPLGSYDEIYLNRIAEGRWLRSYVESDHLEVAAGLGVANVIPNASAVLFRTFRPEPEFVETISAMRMCGDWYFYLRAVLGGNLAFEAQPLNQHRRHGKTVTHQTEGSLRYFDELATIRRYVSANFRVPVATRERADDFTLQDLDRFNITEPNERRRILEGSRLGGDKTVPTLLVVTSDLSPGGGQMFAIRLANAYLRTGGRVVLLNVGVFPDHAGVVSRIDPRVILSDARRADFSFRRLLEDYDIDIVHSSLWWADRFVQERIGELGDRVAWCVTAHGCYETLLNKPDTDRSFPQRFPAMLRRVDEWIYIADKNLAVFDRFGRPDRLTKVASGFEPQAPAELTREALGLRAQSLVLLLASRAIEAKGWSEAVEVVERLNRNGIEIDLMLAGEGPVADRLKATRLPPHVHLYGHVDNVQDYIAVADVGLLPTYFEGESMPLIVIEMLAQGKPVVATDAGEIEAMLTLDGPAGRVVAGSISRLQNGALSVADLEKALMNMTDSQARKAAGDAASSIFENRFRMETMIVNYVNIYGSIIRKRRFGSD